MKNTTLIDIQKDFTGEERMTREGGEKLRNLILAGPHPITIDFHKKPIASVSFWDESIAKLLLSGWNKIDIESKIKFKNIHYLDKPIIDKLIMARS